MPIIVNQISSPLNATEQEVISTALKKLGSVSKHAIDCEIHKSSLDARKRNDIHFVHSVFVTLDSADLEKKLCEKNTSLTYVERSVYKPVISTEKAELSLQVLDQQECSQGLPLPSRDIDRLF